MSSRVLLSMCGQARQPRVFTEENGGDTITVQEEYDTRKSKTKPQYEISGLRRESGFFSGSPINAGRCAAFRRIGCRAMSCLPGV